VVGSQIGILTPSLSFGHNLCFEYANGTCESSLDMYVPRAFQRYNELFNLMIFYLYNHSLKIQESMEFKLPKWEPIWECEFIPSLHFQEHKKCDSRASFMVCTFASPYFSHEPKAKVVIIMLFQNVIGKNE